MVKSFLLNKKGDIVISGGKIQMTSGKDLLRQTVETVIGTNNGEWFLNVDEGINFKSILGKNVNADEVRSEIQKGLLQVDEALFIQDFETETEERTLKVKFTASNGAETIEGVNVYAG